MWYNEPMDIRLAIISIVISLFGFAGGGGSSSGGSSSSGGGSSSGGSSYSSGSSSSSRKYSGPINYNYKQTVGEKILAEVVMVTIVAGPIIVLIILYLHGRRQDKKFLQSRYKDNNNTAYEKDIHSKAKEVFKAYQADWSNFNIENIKNYTSPHYFQHATLMLELLKSMDRVNKVSKLKIEGVYLQTPVSQTDSLPTEVSVTFLFNGLDEVINTKTNDKLYSYHAYNVKETWNFIYDGQKLCLDSISQPTESSDHIVERLATFASENNLYYSPDWGRYAIPSKGMLFNDFSIKVSDINNHIVGKWGDLLVQLYTYAKTPSHPDSYYIVGQISVPKDYLGVIVKSKKTHLDIGIKKHYDKYELEWGEFNERYDVYASKQDALPAFELLNPKFMEYLYSKNPNYNLEVIDNAIYIFANIKSVTSRDYNDMLDILQMAYKELKQ